MRGSIVIVIGWFHVQIALIVQGERRMNSEEAELMLWSLPRLFTYSNVKQLTAVLDEVDLIETIIMSGTREFLVTIKFTGREIADLRVREGV